MSLMALLVLGSALPVQAYIGFALGNPVGGTYVGACDGAQLLEPTAGQMFMARANGNNDFLSVLNNGTTLKGCNGWSGGFYDCPGGNFHPEPTTAAEAVYVVVPMYPSGEAATQHRGWAFVDVTPGTTADFGANVSQGFEALSVGPYYATSGAAGTNSGFDYRFRGLVEFGRDQVGAITCRVGGDPAATDYASRAIAGYNIYRLNNIPVGTSTPQHYLCGPDLNCGTKADNGWIAFIPSGTGAGGSGLNLSTPAAAAASSDNNVNDAFGVQGGPNGTGVEQDIVLIYSDNPGRSATAPANLQGVYSYVAQPVLKGTIPASTGACGPLYGSCRVGDLTGDTVNDAWDLDGDTSWDFVSPQADGGTAGLGLTADLAGSRTILVSTDMEATGSNANPAGDALQFQGIYNGKSQAFDINFISAIETGVAGFNLYRSIQPNDSTSFAKVNGNLIPAKGTSLSSYVYSDPVRVQARRGDVTFYYKVEAVRTDGTTKLYGPYQVTYTGATEQRRDRGMR